ncbi:MAG: glutamate--tRNA ligase [Candidatus Krumholzibacteria bacterium]|nr:glutamate--tRNA ligase [Candidatus Krumholzibacteria bacterium]
MKEVRVRFAPSPTGHLHVGGARTALFNWLFARHEGGRFILRIEDTDVERSSADLESGILDDLMWLGLAWDEGPDRGGAYGPYRQSERVARYREGAERLVAEGRAYPCFCTEEELERKKEERRRANLPPQYDGTCRRLDDAARARKRTGGEAESVRFIVPPDSERRLDDFVRGEVVFPAGMVGDFVILRSNGLPTYNFAAAIDDAAMAISHVIRGEEHLSNTVRQIMIYEALGLEPPRFAHIPLILGLDRSKLSKRHGAPNVWDFHTRGYPAEAIVNYLAFLGWSPPGDREMLSLDELVEKFKLDRVSSSPSIFDEVKLNWFSAQYVKRGGARRYLDEALPHFPEDVRAAYPRERLAEIFEILAENLPSFSRIVDEIAPFRPGIPALAGEAREAVAGARELLSASLAALGEGEEWSAASIGGRIKDLGARLQVKGKALYIPIRAAVTGSLHGPDLSRVMEIRGRESVLRAIRSALAGIETP